MKGASIDLQPWWDRLDRAVEKLGARIDWPRDRLFDRDLALGPPGRTSPNGHCHLFRARDGWLALNLARQDDVDLLPALFQREIANGQLPSAFAAADVAHWRERAVLLGLPLAMVGETAGCEPALLWDHAAPAPANIASLRVLDLSALWAGPLVGTLFAAAGAEVTRLEHAKRPDPTAENTPLHAMRLNGQKRVVRKPFDATTLAGHLAKADLLITSARPAALSRLGLVPERALADRPDLLWIAVTAYGWNVSEGQRVGFGDDCAAAAGLLGWPFGEPVFRGDALADPLTGLVAATVACEALARNRRGLIDAGLAPCAALFAGESH